MSNNLFRLNLENFIKIGEGSTGIVCIATENTSLKQVGPLTFVAGIYILYILIIPPPPSFEIQFFSPTNKFDGGRRGVGRPPVKFC